MFESLFYNEQQSLKREIVTIITYFLAQFFGVMAVAVIMVTIFQTPTDTLQQYGSHILFWVSLLSFVIALGLNFQYLKKHFLATPFFRSLRYAMLFTFIGFLLSILVSAVFVTPDTSVNQQIIQDLVGQAPKYLFVTVVFLAPITEEITFRLALQGMISRKSRLFGALLSFIVFVMLHLSTELINGTLTLAAFAAYLAMPLTLTYVYYRTNNLLIVILMHVFNNFLSFMVMYSLI